MKKRFIKSTKVGVKVVFCCNDNVLYYKTSKGIQDLPGGHIEFKETLFDALKRELKEEIGYKLTSQPKLLYSWTYLSRDKSRHEVYVGYLINLKKRLKFSSKEFGNKIKFIWLSKKDIKKQHFLPEMEIVLLKALQNK